MAFTTIPTRTATDPVASADINALMQNDLDLNKPGLSVPIPGAITSGATMLYYFRLAKATSASKIQASLGTPGTGQTSIFDIKYHATVLASAVSVFATAGNKPTIADGGQDADSGAVDGTSSYAAGGYIAIFCDQAGTNAADLCITFVP